MKKLELGCGDRPTPGYLHQDITQLVPLDYKCQPWEVDLPENSLSEVIAIGVMEHLRFEDFRKTLKHVYFMLEPNGIFLFDVPDIKVWSKYLYDVLHNKPTPFTREHIFSTMYGWQRWPGDEHKSCWTYEDLFDELAEIGFLVSSTGFIALQEIMNCNIVRNRFTRPEDAHCYVKAIKR